MAFPGKEVLIGETGWPSKGRMRDEALPSRINQARFLSDILDRAKHENFRVILFEAYDGPWKRQWEGTVGGYWGLFDGDASQAEIPPRSSYQQLSVLEAAVGMRAGSEHLRIRSSMVDAEASAMAAAIDIVGCCGSIRDHQRDSAGRKPSKTCFTKVMGSVIGWSEAC